MGADTTFLKIYISETFKEVEQFMKFSETWPHSPSESIA
jgi:hypothetical protein